MFGQGGYEDCMGDLAPASVIPAGFVTPTPDNPLGIPGLGGTLVIPQLPPIPGVTPPPAAPAQPIPGGGTDPNNPKVGPLFGPPGSPGTQPSAAASLTSSPIVMLLIGGLAVFLLMKVIK